ncbi:MAG: hypothetical protein ACHQC8_02490 [Solirubrobacterales bacterium]
MKGIIGLLMAGTVLALGGGLFMALIRPAVKIAGRWQTMARSRKQALRIVAEAHRKYSHAELLLAMSAATKHGGHRIPLDIGALAAGAAADTSSIFTYDGEAASILGTVDRSIECVKSAVLTFEDAITGIVTNNFAVEVTHWGLNAAGVAVVKNSIVYTFANAVNAVAMTPIDLSGPVAGALTNPTGKVIQGDNWTLFPGDSIQVERVSNGTGLASNGFTVTLKIGSLGS